jgi:hypothetical protein
MFNKLLALLNPAFPLWLPEGSVRALMALGIVGGFSGYLLATGELPDQAWQTLVAVTGFYFITRK